MLKKHQLDVRMEINDDKAGLILNAIGLAIVELIGGCVPITRDKLERNRREPGNVIGNGANWYAVQLVRRGI